MLIDINACPFREQIIVVNFKNAVWKGEKEKVIFRGLAECKF